MTKLLFITDLYPVFENEKVTPRTLYDFVYGFRELGVGVDVIKPNFILNSFLRKKPFYRTGQYKDVFNVNYHLPFLGKIENKLKGSTVLDTHYSAIVSHMPSGSIFAYKLACKLGLPLICGIHISDLDVLTKPIYAIYFKRALLNAFRYAKLLACRSDIIKKRLIKFYPEFENKVFTAYSGVEDDIIFDRANETLLNDKIKVLTCANFKKRKNIDKVIKACKGLESFDLTVIGDGTQRKNLEKIDRSVKFTGYLPHAKVLEYMRNSDIFVLPSVGETLGMVYLEAMASGCITVATKDDGIDGIIKNNINGFLVTPDEIEIADILLNIKKLDKKSLETLRCNSFNTIKKYTKKQMCAYYLQQIFKIM